MVKPFLSENVCFLNFSAIKVKIVDKMMQTLIYMLFYMSSKKITISCGNRLIITEARNCHE